MRIAVVTISDRASAGMYQDRSGPAIEEILTSAVPGASVVRSLVPDGKESVREALQRHLEAGADWIVTTGGTGPSARDTTPEATEEFCDRSVPGIAEYLRTASLAQTPNAVFSRLFAGMRGSVYVVNLPGSERAARFCAGLIAPLMDHGTRMALGGDH